MNNLQLPWGPQSQPTPIGFSPIQKSRFVSDGTDITIGAVINRFGEVAIYAGAFMMFFWALWGVFDYLKAEGNKEALAKARKKIIWAISGFVILILAFFVSDALQSILKIQEKPLQGITAPPR